MIVIKYSIAGLVTWATTFNSAGPGTDVSYSIDTDSLKNVYISGIYASSATVNLLDANTTTKNQTSSLVTLGAAAGSTPVLIKYNSSGITQWAVNIFNPKTAGQFALSIVVNKSIGHVYVVGYYNPSSPVTLFNVNGNTQIASSVTLPTTTVTTGRMFIVKYSLDGIIKCATYIDSTNTNIFKGIDIAQYGNYLHVTVFCPTLAATGRLYNGTINTQSLSPYQLSISSNTCGALIKYLG
jgi:hypothetical protein